MEIIAFIILIFVWYYGYSLLTASELNTKVLSKILDEQNLNLVSIREDIYGVEKHLNTIENNTFSAALELEDFNKNLKHFNKNEFKTVLDKLDDIALRSMDLSGIKDELGRINSSVDTIVANPAFTYLDR